MLLTGVKTTPGNLNGFANYLVFCLFVMVFFKHTKTFMNNQRCEALKALYLPPPFIHLLFIRVLLLLLFLLMFGIFLFSIFLSKNFVSCKIDSSFRS